VRRLDLSRRTAVVAAIVISLLVLAGAGTGVGLWLHARPVLHIASSAQDCVNAPDHVASLFSDDQNTLIRLSNLDYSDIRVLRVEPANHLPGMFGSLLALTSDSRRLAYVTADDEQMDNSRIQYLDVSNPASPVPLVDLAQGLTPIRPAWSPDNSQLAYVVGRPPADGRPADFEVWSARTDGTPPQKVTDLPLDVFARGHSASLCFTPSGQIGLLQGVESAQGQLGPSPLTGPGAASSPRTQTPSPAASPTPNGSPCGVPVFSQNDPTWSQLIMQAGGDPIGGYGCALTSTTMLLNYYGSPLSPIDLNSCLGPGADPIVWQSAPACTQLKVQGGIRSDFSWDGLDAFLKAGKPVIVGMVRGLTGMHFVVVTQGGGGEADSYHITDPWDGTTTKTLGSYTNSGYNPRWIISYDGAGRTCARLVSIAPPVGGFHDGGTSKNPVTISNPPNSGNTGTVHKLPPTTGGGGSGGPSPSPSTSPSGSPSPTPAATPTPTPTSSPTTTPSSTPSATPTTIATAKPPPTPAPKPTPRDVWTIRPGAKITLSDEGTYLVYVRHGSSLPPRFSILKFTIDRTPPVLSLVPLDSHSGPVHTLAFRPLADDPATGPVLDRPGQLRLAASDTLSGVQSIDYQLDGSPWTSYSDDVSFRRTLLVPTVGTHSISVRATDLAGNSSELDNQPFTVVDTSTPSPSPSSSPSPTPTPTPTPTTRRKPTATPTAQPPPPTPTPTPTPVPPPTLTVSTLSVTPQPPQPCPRTFTVTATIAYTGTGVVTFGWLHGSGNLTHQTSVQGPFNQPFADAGLSLPDQFGATTMTDQLEVLSPIGGLSNQVTLSCVPPPPPG
jgi:Peptidase_C39 like family